MRVTYKNGVIYTGDGWGDSFTVENGKFIRVGTLDREADNGEIVDLHGRFVCAGFNDSHMHLLNLGQALAMADLAAHTGSLEEVLR